ncbi:uncharacterized protein RHO25_001174 [Cercospora beticola]|uniref:Fe2OG dioxygenase domain-containing protein n=2 Tax=Cercospora beticola TaxID=122368 RepID=A0ABZ0NAK5_CERBT|nr:hypothetical protein RHO25_001174 [Cercospora beticola]CAK1355096.1 unnamed protein product [Cercospora beticola]
MTATIDAHARPPESMRETYKRYQKATTEAVLSQPDLIQIGQEADRYDAASHDVGVPANLSGAFASFLDREPEPCTSADSACIGRVYEIPGVPGLYIYPSLLSSAVQLELLDKLLHRDVSNPRHSTNVHRFHRVEYPPSEGTGSSASFFSPAATSTIFEPLDPAVHKPFGVQQFWNKKLRWITLGGQYDWTEKQYPSEDPPEFPADIKKLVEDLFPMKAEAAILNLYSPGDTLSLHRDVSEESNQPLVSISIGCDAIFIAGLEEKDVSGGNCSTAAIRLRSGDAVLMSGPSRYAWHGVPKVLPNTCPEWLQSWPAAEKAPQYQVWKNWMGGKRINLNVRQMFD